MHPECYTFIQSKPEYRTFIRFHPSWYRKLNKHPELLPQFIEASREYHGQTFPQRLEKWQKNAQFLSMVMQLFTTK
ncbi:YlbE-like family protein [Salibacterium aidingense]|uniref:YlbE-like family protein n=1 Tax=Salibacterium aidingense TaxID=384933 RepID=UPI0003FA97E4|nr:YlbE-like family protein [Salibacterium aidingense]